MAPTDEPVLDASRAGERAPRSVGPFALARRLAQGARVALFGRRRRLIHLLLALVIGLGVALLAGVSRARNLPLDDAYIHLSYGLGDGFLSLFSFQDGQRDTGTSSWLWTLICILVVKLRLPEHGALTVLSIGIFSGILFRVMELVDRALPRDVPLRALFPPVAALLLAASGNVVWLSLTGMETGLSILLLLVVVPRLLTSGFTLGTGVIALLAIWTRIEAVIWLGTGVLLLRWTGERHARRAWRGALLPLLGIVLYLAYNQHVSGHLLPTTALAKRASFIPGGHSFEDEKSFVLALHRNYLRHWTPGWLVELEVVAASSLLLFLVSLRRLWRARDRLDPARAAVFALLAGAVAHVIVNIIGFRSGYHHLRYFAPALFLIPALSAVMALLALNALLARLLPRVGVVWARGLVSALGVSLVAFPLGVGLYRDQNVFPRWATLYQKNAEQLGAVHLAVGAFVREAVPLAKRVASFDIGALRWASGLSVADLGGVLDAHALGYLLARKPADFVRDTRAEVYVSVENGWDSIRRVQPSYELVPLRTFQVPEYHDPYPPHSKRMVVYRVNHCGERRLVREEVGSKQGFEFSWASEKGRAGAGMAEGSSFARWPISARDLRRNVPLAEGSFVSSDAHELKDKATGRFETVAMKAEGAWLSFRVAGGHDPEKLRIELRSEGRVIATWTGFDTDSFLEVVHPLGGLSGRMFSLALVDEAKGGWGHLMLDEIKQFDWRELPPKPCPAKSASTEPLPRSPLP